MSAFDNFILETTERARTATLQASLIAGINKYSHDASLCLIDSTKGDIVFAQAKERLSGKKHDGGGVADLIEYALNYLDARPEDITTVVNNNHHYRVNPYERRLTFASALKYEEADRLRVTNASHAKKRVIQSSGACMAS